MPGRIENLTPHRRQQTFQFRYPPIAFLIWRRSNSVIPWDRTILRCGVTVEIDHDRVDIAPAPAFRRVVSLDDGMPGRVKMGCRVTQGRLITAAHVTAGSTDSQVKPRAADPEAVLTASRARRHRLNVCTVPANWRHPASPYLVDCVWIAPEERDPDATLPKRPRSHRSILSKAAAIWTFGSIPSVSARDQRAMAGGRHDTNVPKRLDPSIFAKLPAPSLQHPPARRPGLPAAPMWPESVAGIRRSSGIMDDEVTSPRCHHARRAAGRLSQSELCGR
ncbi:hypothetical protein JHFBIEKO_3349 [Methylobacterium mesophilicum]|nr:hypothetical protein JHFBIEKO_3349 [Methylobacterium mesophilicum]